MDAREHCTLELRLDEKGVKLMASEGDTVMSAAAEKIKALQEGQLANLRHKYRHALDPNDPEVRERIAEQIAALDPEDEEDAMRWIESVQDFDNEDAEKE